MDIEENIAGLGKNHDKETQESGNDIAKKQSDAKPAAENIDMEPHSVDKSELENTDTDDSDIKQDAADYAEQEHQKAADWEHKDLKNKP
ncbi:MAG: hypothetical protein EOO47_05250 [Flavobacterium sp.]|nr:MAG: hypothetical protein EOO47_05250 [Flavobacterium sp.]